MPSKLSTKKKAAARTQPRSQQRRVVPPTTFDALKPIADAALAASLTGYRIAMAGMLDDTEYKRGADILQLGASTLTQINQIKTPPCKDWQY